jgi:hypothetical protein
VTVRAHAEAVAVLAEVEVGVGVAQHREHRAARVDEAPQLLEEVELARRGRPGVLVCHRRERHRDPDHRADQRAPHPRRGDDDLGGDPAVIGLDAADPLAAGVDPGDPYPVPELRAPRGGRAGLGLGGAERDGHAVGGDVQAAEDDLPVDQGVQGRAPGRPGRAP